MTAPDGKPLVTTLSRNEMKSRALAFAKRWAGDQREEAEAKTFLDEFFTVFGRDRRAVDAQAVLDARAPHLARCASLADLYDPLAMSAELLKTHNALDHAVDRAYRAAPFTSERERVEFLFALYEKLTAPLAPVAKPAKRPRAKNPPSTNRKPKPTPPTTSSPRKTHRRAEPRARVHFARR